MKLIGVTNFFSDTFATIGYVVVTALLNQTVITLLEIETSFLKR